MKTRGLTRWVVVLVLALLIGLLLGYLNDRYHFFDSPLPPAAPASTPAEGGTSAPLPTLSPTAEAAAPDPSPASNDELPAPTLFDVAWDDRALWQDGWVEAVRDRANALTTATVYHLQLTLADDYRSFTGAQELRYTNNESDALNEIYFRLFPNLFDGSLTLDQLTLNGTPVEGVLELEESALRLPLDEPLPPGQSVVITMRYEVEIPPVNEQNYGAFGWDNVTLALAHAYPLIPAYDESGWNIEIPPPSGDVIFADSSFYLVEIDAPADFVMALSGRVIDEREAEGRRTVTVAAGPTRDFYLAGSEGWEEQQQQVGETLLRSYAFPENAATNAETLRIGAASVEAFNALVGPYPFTELELAATPNLALGIEYPGVVVMTDRLYQQPNEEPWSLYLEPTVAHEVAHQWFYSTVGNDQLDAPWLDEALAQYLTFRYLRTTNAEAAAGFEASLQERWQRVGDAPIPIGLPVAAYTPQEYGAIVYGRGPLFFIELESTLGTATLDDFLRNYYNDNLFGIGTDATLRASAEAACDCDLSEAWAEWVAPRER